MNAFFEIRFHTQAYPSLLCVPANLIEREISRMVSGIAQMSKNQGNNQCIVQILYNLAFEAVCSH
jgi:hypothetical protein